MAFGLNLGNLVTHLLADNTQYAKVMRASEVMLTKFSRNAEMIGRRMALTITAPLALIGGASVRAFGNFNDAMTQSLAIMGNVSDEMRSVMEREAKFISRNSITSATELGRAYFYLASAGLDAAQSIEALGTVEQFAVAGMFDMAQATDLLTDAQSALGMTVADATENMTNMTRIGDVLVKANTLANASVEQFSRALTNRAAASLRMLNKDVEEGVAVLAAFADQGSKGEMAGERLAIVLRDLQRAAIKESEAWERMGLRVFDAGGTMLPIVDILEQLENSFGKMSDQQKKATAQMLGFQDRSFSALQTLLGTSDKIRIYEKALRDAGGTTKEVSDKQLTSFNSQMKILWNNIVLVGIEIGETLAPWIGRLSEHIKAAIGWWNTLNRTTKEWLAIGATILAITGPMLILFGMLAVAVAKLIAVFTTLGVVGMAWIAVAGMVAAAIWLIADAISDADLGLLKFVNNVRVKGLRIGTYMQLIATYIWQAWEWWGSQMDVVWYGFRNTVFDVGGAIYRFMLKVAKGVADAYIQMVEKTLFAVNWLAEKLTGMKDFFGSYAKSISDFLDKEIGASLDNSEKRYEQYFNAVQKAQREHSQQAKIWSDVRKQILQDDAAMGLGELMAQNKVQETVVREVKKVDKAAKEMTGGVQEAEKAPVGGPSMSLGQFREISLRRISLAQSAPVRTKKQQVSDEGVEKKLDQIYQLMSDKKAATAVLG
jgi:TP901 family phage tail tape measure protein